ncbi:hypothetical protein [Marinomonas ostreistagni]|uniref:hypothetical protein n=1 Tax=Marinomonas ostreistagni TaxID=359209 RepID=UPI00194DBC9C|nr:hypothetical protein [Marinomonas ostreistagni]MBM6549896.1 hypothetical protein [Marinomonas ostreistagni]
MLDLAEPEWHLAEPEQDELSLLIALPEAQSSAQYPCVAHEQLADTLVAGDLYDAVLVASALTEQDRVADLCAKLGTELIIFEHPTGDQQVLQDALLNITDKLFSDEMPSNLGLQDIRNLKLNADCIFAFTSHLAALDFMATQTIGELADVVYLAHGHSRLNDLKAGSDALEAQLPENSFICASLLSSGRSECTILLGVRKD